MIEGHFGASKIVEQKGVEGFAERITSEPAE